MTDQLHMDQMRWAQMIRNATPGGHKAVPEIELTDVVVEQEPLEFNSEDLLGCDIENSITQIVQPINGFGECILCHKHKRLWSSVCAYCGADPEDFEEE
jgi:hypothetical protein